MQTTLTLLCMRAVVAKISYLLCIISSRLSHPFTKAIDPFTPNSLFSLTDSVFSEDSIDELHSLCHFSDPLFDIGMTEAVNNVVSSFLGFFNIHSKIIFTITTNLC